MQPLIQYFPPRMLLGMRMQMCLNDNLTPKLWQRFMSRKKEIAHLQGSDLYSLQVFAYDMQWEDFLPETLFEKWACAPIDETQHTIPENMEAIYVEGGMYAVFEHKGSVETAEQTFRYIFETWMPNSQFVMAPRPHFEILGEKYKHDSEDSVEEIWIPILHKA